MGRRRAFCTGRERFSKQLRNYLSRGFYLLNKKKQRKMRALSSQACLTVIYSVYSISYKLNYNISGFIFITIPKCRVLKCQLILLLLGIPHFMGTQFVQGIEETQAGANEPM